MDHILYMSLSGFIAICGYRVAIDGFRNSLLLIRKFPDNFKYEYFGFLRLTLVFVAGAAMYIGSRTKFAGDSSDFVGVSALAIWVILTIYPHIIMFFGSINLTDE